MNISQEHINELATQARADFGSGDIARPLLRKLYGDYNPGLTDFDAFLDQANELFPAYSTVWGSYSSPPEKTW